MIPARRGNDAGLRRVPGQQVRERAARFERARVLQLFELERECERRQAEVGAARLHDRRDADVRRDDGVDTFDAGAADGEAQDRRSRRSADRRS